MTGEITMSWNKYFLALTLVALAANAYSANLASCPPSFKADNAIHPLSDAELFDGLPAELANLIPDTENETVWTLPIPRDKGQAFYLLCKYQNTKNTVTVAVPDTAKRCEVTWSGKKSSRKTHAVCF